MKAWKLVQGADHVRSLGVVSSNVITDRAPKTGDSKCSILPREIENKVRLLLGITTSWL